LFEWLSIATPDTEQKKEADPFQDFDPKNDPSKLSELKIRLDEFFCSGCRFGFRRPLSGLAKYRKQPERYVQCWTAKDVTFFGC
jgi:hypothetical protein